MLLGSALIQGWRKSQTERPSVDFSQLLQNHQPVEKVGFSGISSACSLPSSIYLYRMCYYYNLGSPDEPWLYQHFNYWSPELQGTSPAFVCKLVCQRVPVSHTSHALPILLCLYNIKGTQAWEFFGLWFWNLYFFVLVKVLLKKNFYWTIIGGDRIVLRILRLRRTNKFWWAR